MCQALRGQGSIEDAGQINRQLVGEISWAEGPLRAEPIYHFRPEGTGPDWYSAVAKVVELYPTVEERNLAQRKNLRMGAEDHREHRRTAMSRPDSENEPPWEAVARGAGSLDCAT